MVDIFVKVNGLAYFSGARMQGDQIGRNFAIWAIFYGKIFSRKNAQ
jgi:hypothetical protein